jgi:hypothetical protein
MSCSDWLKLCGKFLSSDWNLAHLCKGEERLLILSYSAAVCDFSIQHIKSAGTHLLCYMEDTLHFSVEISIENMSDLNFFHLYIDIQMS